MIDKSLFLEFLDSMHNSIIGIDLNNRVIIYNKSCEEFIGLSRNKVIGKNIFDIIPNSRLPYVLENETSETGKRFVLNSRVIYSNRTPLFQNGKIYGAIAVFSDIKEISKIREQLDTTEKNLKALEILIDSAYEGILIVDKNGYITKFNKKYEEFLNLDPAETIGKHVTEVIENTRMHIIAKTGKVERGHVQRIQGHDMIASRFPIIKDGEVIGAIGKVLFQDVKELESLAKRMDRVHDEFNYFRNEIKKLQEAKYSFDNIITNDPTVLSLKKLGMQAAMSSSTILITGESGTGKELFAHAIHKASSRKYGAFIRVNCSSIPKNLFESELFGYEKGAFTGAKKEGKPGKFEMANGGTIFLDEIGTMPLSMQAKILRVLQEKEVERVGGSKTIELDIRIIAATNEDLYSLVESNRFREDLYYRLNVIKLELPALRQRKDDIVLIARHLLNEFVSEMGLPEMKFHKKTLALMKGYQWPGNIRELRNCIERCIHLTETKRILPTALPEYMQGNAEKVFDEGYTLKAIVEKAEYKAITKVLKEVNNNKTEAARILGIHRTSLYNKLNRFDIE